MRVCQPTELWHLLAGLKHHTAVRVRGRGRDIPWAPTTRLSLRHAGPPPACCILEARALVSCKNHSGRANYVIPQPFLPSLSSILLALSLSLLPPSPRTNTLLLSFLPSVSFPPPSALHPPLASPARCRGLSGCGRLSRPLTKAAALLALFTDPKTTLARAKAADIRLPPPRRCRILVIPRGRRVDAAGVVYPSPSARRLLQFWAARTKKKYLTLTTQQRESGDRRSASSVLG